LGFWELGFSSVGQIISGKTQLAWSSLARSLRPLFIATSGKIFVAYLYIRNIEEASQEPKLATKDAMTIGFSLVSLIKQIGNLGG
jgi:hypothetical protein